MSVDERNVWVMSTNDTMIRILKVLDMWQTTSLMAGHMLIEVKFV